MPTNLSFGTHAKCFWVVIDVWTLPPYRYCVERRRRRHFNTTNVYIFGPSSQLNSNMNLSYLLLLFIIILGDPASLVTANKCFADRDELKTAIDGYMINIEGCRGSKNECAVGQIYGWPMNNWCTGNVTDMGRLFFNMQEFNEDISFSWRRRSSIFNFSSIRLITRSTWARRGSKPNGSYDWENIE